MEMSSKLIRKIAAAVMCAVVGLSGSIAAFAADKTYSVPELGDMQITLPENMSAITRSADSNDSYFSEFGINYDSTMSNFKSGNIYLQGLNSTDNVIITVTMTETEESKGINNYNLLQSDKLSEVARNFLSNNEYIACTADEPGNDVVWLNFNVKVNKISTYQANTVYGGKSISVTYQRNTGSVTPGDYRIFSSIVSSISFGKTPIFGDYITYIIIGAAALAIIILIIIIVVAVRSGKRKKKKNENDRILEELADKYTRKNKSQSVEKDEPETAYVKEADSVEPEEIKNLEKIIEIHSDEPSRRFSDDDIDAMLGDVESENFTEVVPEEIEEEPKTEIVTSYQENLLTEETTENQADDITDEKEDDFFAGVSLENKISETKFEVIKPQADEKSEGDEPDELEEYMNDEVLVREDFKNNRFDDSDDFFDEAPKKTYGVISSKEIAQAEEYDVIGEVEKRVSEVEQETPSNGEAVVATLKKIGGGIKSFFTHCGYFAINVSREIKRANAKRKRKKAEEERRRRARERAAAQRARARQRENGGLVQVRSRDDRPQQRNSQSRSNNTRRR